MEEPIRLVLAASLLVSSLVPPLIEESLEPAELTSSQSCSRVIGTTLHIDLASLSAPRPMLAANSWRSSGNDSPGITATDLSPNHSVPQGTEDDDFEPVDPHESSEPLDWTSSPTGLKGRESWLVGVVRSIHSTTSLLADLHSRPIPIRRNDTVHAIDHFSLSPMLRC